MLKIDHPQVYIYSYQLSSDSKTDVDSIWTWVNNLWQHFSQDKTQVFSQANLSYPLTKPNKFTHSNQIDGSLKFCCIDDSEGILARIGSPETEENKDLEIATALTQFNVDNLLVADSHENWLGQTLLITYKSKTDQQQSNDFRKVADECLKHLFPEVSVRPPFYRATELFDAPMFEYNSPKSQLQVFVYLVDDDIEGKLGKIIQPLFELFYHRHKITKAFIDSRRNYDLLKERYLEIEQTIENLEAKITEVNRIELATGVDAAQSVNVNIDESLKYLKTKLKELLRESLNYERALECLEDFNNTINIHVYNYQEKLLQIGDKSQILTDELITFKFFIDRTCRYFQEQIKGDLGYFKHGTDLIKIAVELVGGIVDIEQAECDRSLERKIEILGAGLGAGGIVVSAVSAYVETPLVFRIPQTGDRLHPAIASLLWSLLAVVIVAGVVGLINGTWKINGRLRLFGRKSAAQLPHSHSPPVNDILQQTEEVRDARQGD
jgi:prefoldin subunit 5